MEGWCSDSASARSSDSTCSSSYNLHDGWPEPAEWWELPVLQSPERCSSDSSAGDARYAESWPSCGSTVAEEARCTRGRDCPCSACCLDSWAAKCEETEYGDTRYLQGKARGAKRYDRKLKFGRRRAASMTAKKVVKLEAWWHAQRLQNNQRCVHGLVTCRRCDGAERRKALDYTWKLGNRDNNWSRWGTGGRRRARRLHDKRTCVRLTCTTSLLVTSQDFRMSRKGAMSRGIGILKPARREKEGRRARRSRQRAQWRMSCKGTLRPSNHHAHVAYHLRLPSGALLRLRPFDPGFWPDFLKRGDGFLANRLLWGTWRTSSFKGFMSDIRQWAQSMPAHHDTIRSFNDHSAYVMGLALLALQGGDVAAARRALQDWLGEQGVKPHPIGCRRVRVWLPLLQNL